MTSLCSAPPTAQPLALQRAAFSGRRAPPDRLTFPGRSGVSHALLKSLRCQPRMVVGQAEQIAQPIMTPREVAQAGRFGGVSDRVADVPHRSLLLEPEH